MSRFLPTLCCLGLFTALACSTHAQDSLVESTPSVAPVPSSLREAAAANPFSLAGAFDETKNPFSFGPLILRPHLSEKFTYNDGLLVIPGQVTNTYINALSVGLLMDIGKNWTVDYTPQWMTYSNRKYQDSLDHTLNVGAGEQWGDWFAQFSELYSRTKTPRIETGRQTQEERSTTYFGLSHAFNNHLSLELGVSQNLQWIEAQPNSYDWSSQEWLVYHVVTRLDLSIGARFGYTDFDPGAYMLYSEPLARLRWRIGDKIVLTAQGGQERRKIYKTGFSPTTTPTYDIGFQYQPFEQTTLNLSGNRAVSPSYFQNSVTDSKGWSASLSQRLLGRYMLNATWSEDKIHYSGSHIVYTPTVNVTDVLDDSGNVIGHQVSVTYVPSTVIDLRNDMTHRLNLRLSTAFSRRGEIALIYDRIHNVSDLAGYSLTSHQIGGEISYKY